MWFLFALIATFGWGFADLFYKKGSDENDRYSHLRTAIWVGLIMGVTALILLPFSETAFSVSSLVTNAVKYSPASLSYIISMVIGYAGLRYLELSIISPIQNASGAFSMIAMLLYFVVTGRITSVSDEYSILDGAGTFVIIVGVVLLAVVEQRLSKSENPIESKKYRFGALALIFPLLYCIFDTVGTAADGIILDGEKGLGLGEIDVLILYGLTFFACGIIIWLFLLFKEKKPFNPFTKKQKSNIAASLCEQFGQIFYVFAMARNPVVAAPMIASYCVISVLLSAVVLHEKMKKSQYISVILVIIGIIALGISEGLAEL